MCRSSDVVFLLIFLFRADKEMYWNVYDVRVKSLVCALSLLFSDILVGVAVEVSQRVPIAEILRGNGKIYRHPTLA